eukprot:Amastigsp_a508346_21.p1 type:complete len:496 gc:universal Amastigsp_a508346_21:68-1555(+)
MGHVKVVVVVALLLALWNACTASTVERVLSSSEAGESLLPRVAPLRDGSGATWVTFFSLDHELHYYVLRAHLLSRDGEPSLGDARGGIVVSAENQGPALYGYDIAVDDESALIVAFCDRRVSLEQESVVVYRIARDGSSSWPGGLLLSSNEHHEAQPRLLLTDDGISVAWVRFVAGGRGSLEYQFIPRAERAAPRNTPQTSVTLFRAPKRKRIGFISLAPSGVRGAFLATFVDDVTIAGNKTLKASLVDTATGEAQKVHTLCASDPLPVGYQPLMAADGAGGAIVVWHFWAAAERRYVVRAQRIDAQSIPQWASATGCGVAVSPSIEGMEQLNPVLSVDADRKRAVIAWQTQSTSGRPRYGVRAAAVSFETGQSLWGEQGVSFSTLEQVSELAAIDGAVFWTQGSKRELWAARLGFGDSPIYWPITVSVSGHNSEKSRVQAATVHGDTVRVVWMDKRPEGEPGHQAVQWVIATRDVTPVVVDPESRLEDPRQKEL